MDIIILEAKKRALTDQEKKSLRRTGKIPAIIYGHQQKNLPIAVDGKKFSRLFKEAGESTMIELNIDDQLKKNVVVKDVQLDPVRDTIQHIDFFEVSLTEKMTAKVPLVFKGESKAVKQESGVLVKNIDEVEVECLPADLPHEIEVDITKLATFEDAIHIADLTISDKVKILVDKEETVAVVTPPRSEEELKELEEKAEEKVEEVEGVAEKPAEAEGAEKPEEGKESKADEKPTAKEGADEKKK